ncbi:hypothetical protein [Aneurinibacillus tyrosinisolvens]|uniref:hypothetical protein n=1 Tax=Aneurinibacillus tyrosinisolvens TaxID=1443435 RepID=UPI00063F7401|nr:hypothetical protein [Aneurinibacillus tyrosinisolvens]
MAYSFQHELRLVMYSYNISMDDIASGLGCFSSKIEYYMIAETIDKTPESEAFVSMLYDFVHGICKKSTGFESWFSYVTGVYDNVEFDDYVIFNYQANTVSFMQKGRTRTRETKSFNFRDTESIKLYRKWFNEEFKESDMPIEEIK